MVSRVAASLAALAAGACTEAPIVRPVIELPFEDPDADPLGASPVDELTVAIARAGSERDLITQTFQRGEPLAIEGLPFGEDLVLHLTGLRQGGAIAYGRTCAFAVDRDGADLPPHVFFARTVRFGSLPSAPLARTGGTAIDLDGIAVLLGGSAGGGSVQDLETYDPRTGELALAGALAARTGAVAAVLGTAPARVAVLGGRSGAFGASFVEIIEPGRAVDTIDDLRTARIGITATSLTDGRVIAVGGHSPGTAPVGAITELAVIGQSVEIRDTGAALAQPRTGHTATRLRDDLGAPVLIAGGTTGVDGGGPPVAVAELYKPLTAELARPATFAPAMLVPRARHHAVLLPDGGVLFLGGVDALGNPVRTLEVFSLEGGFVAVGELPPTAPVLDMTVTALADGRVLITGGRLAPGEPPLDTALIARLDPLDGSIDVLATDRLAVPRAGHQAVLLCDGTVLVTGGTAASSGAERYNPPEAGRR